MSCPVVISRLIYILITELNTTNKIDNRREKKDDRFGVLCFIFAKIVVCAVLYVPVRLLFIKNGACDLYTSSTVPLISSLQKVVHSYQGILSF